MNALLYAPVTVVVSAIGTTELALIGALIVVGLASLPDMDRHFDSGMHSHRSDLWHLVPISHRGITHTVWFGLFAGIAVGGITAFLIPPDATSIVGVSPLMTGALLGGFVTLAILGHIIGDMITPMGVRPFSPVISTRYSLDLVKASNAWANRGLLFGGAIVLIVVFAVVSGTVDTTDITPFEVSG